MAVYIKRGVWGDLDRVTHKGLGRLIKMYRENYEFEDFFITSLRDGNHGDGSLHYIGRAFDFKQQSVPLDHIKEVLGRGWDIIDEGTHVHVEYDPQKWD